MTGDTCFRFFNYFFRRYSKLVHVFSLYLDPVEQNQHKRSRRSVDENAPSSASKIIELAIIADKFYIEGKDEENLINSIKMIAHIVSTV